MNNLCTTIFRSKADISSKWTVLYMYTAHITIEKASKGTQISKNIFFYLFFYIYIKFLGIVDNVPIEKKKQKHLHRVK